MEAGALEEAFPDVGHTPFHLGLVPGMPYPGRVDEESPVLGVFQESPAQARLQRVRPHHRGGKLSMTRHLGIPPKKAQRRPTRL